MTTWNVHGLPRGKPGTPERKAYDAARKATPSERAASRQRTRNWYAQNRDRALRAGREHKLRLRYGITTAEWNELLAVQEGRCKICRTDEPGKHGFHVDHCHVIGTTKQAVRGLLCCDCNRMLGAARDEAARLRAGAGYLDAFYGAVSA